MRRSSSLLLLCLLALPLRAATTPQVSIQYMSKDIAVTGATPGGQIVLFGISRVSYGHADALAKRFVVKTADGTGAATFSFDDLLPRSSIYAAVDYESGAYTVASPATWPLPLKTFPTSALRKSADLFDQLGLDRISLQVLCVRPKKGAWQLFLTDCAGHDRDGACDGKILLDAGTMHPIIKDSGELKDFKAHDVLIILDPEEFDVMATEVGK